MGVGFAKDGESSIRNNRRLKNATKEKYFKHQEYKKDKNTLLTSKKSSPEDLSRIRNRLRKQKKRARIRVIVAVTLFVVLLIYCFI